MGSCISTKKSTPPPPLPPLQPPQLKDRHLQDRTLVPESDPPCEEEEETTKIQPSLPSPPPLEEETVKEVVSSETPSLKPNYLKYNHQHQQQKILRLPSFPRLEEKKNNSHFEEISEVSDNCSLSESVCTSAFTEYEEVTHRPRVIDRSPSKIQRKRTNSGEFYTRSESPVTRKNDIAGKSVVYNKEVGQQMFRPRNLSQNGMVVKDQGESSRRRSRSPAATTQTGMLCRSPSGNKIGRSVGRSPSRSPEIGRNVEARKPEMWPAKESLDDPLVSLECFIFL